MSSSLTILKALTVSLSPDHNDSVFFERIGGISIIDINGIYLNVNKKYANTCGYDPEELENKHWSITVHSEDMAAALEAYEKMKIGYEASVDIRGLRKDGAVFKKTVTFIRRDSLEGEFIGHYCLMNERD